MPAYQRSTQAYTIKMCNRELNGLVNTFKASVFIKDNTKKNKADLFMKSSSRWMSIQDVFVADVIESSCLFQLHIANS